MFFRWRKNLSWRQLKKSQIAAPLVLCICFLFLTSRYLFRGQNVPSEVFTYRPLSPLVKHQATFWRSLYMLILTNDPKCDAETFEAVVPHKLDLMFNPAKNRARPDLLWIRPTDVLLMKDAHAKYLRDLKDLSDMFYVPGTRGIAMTAGFKQLPVLTISLRMLRRTGCNLPLEVFLAGDADYDKHICEDVFPTLNAQCVVIADIFRAAGTGVLLERVQYKVLALLFSSFEDVLLLDSDAFPISDPTSTFDSKPFVTDGMILWPDFWYPSESPYFFDIIAFGKTPLLNSRPAIESGQMMFSKSKHNTTLTLAAYYNYFGPSYYYPLLSQGAPGQGDKETFGWAAAVLSKPFYIVHEPVLALGHVDTNGAFFGSAMAQHNPTLDHQHHSNQTYGAPQQHPQTAPALKSSLPSTHQIPPLFIHANFPKFDPSTIFQYTTQAKSTIGPCFDSNNTPIRAWNPVSEMELLFSFDIEYLFWEEIEYVACTHEGDFKAWEGKKDICFGVQEYRKAVFT